MNYIVLSGRFTSDLEVKYTPSQMAIVNVNMAVQRNKKGETDFPRITIFGKQAENVAMYCKKGSRVLVQGRIQTRTYNDKNGNTVYATDVIAERVEFLDGVSDNPKVEFENIQEEFPF